MRSALHYPASNSISSGGFVESARTPPAAGGVGSAEPREGGASDGQLRSSTHLGPTSVHFKSEISDVLLVCDTSGGT
jgi:hypothetical protein